MTKYSVIKIISDGSKIIGTEAIKNKRQYLI